MPQDEPHADAAQPSYLDRIQRRLLGHYESLKGPLAQTVANSQDVPLTLNAIRIEGSPHTRTDFLARLCDPFLTPFPGQEAATYSLHDLIGISRRLADTLERFDIYSDVQATLQDSPNVFAQRGDVDIVLSVKEASRFHARMATDIGNNEGNATFTTRVRNLFGGAELFEATLSSGTRTKFNYSARLEAPVLSNPDLRAQILVYATEKDLALWSSCRENLQGAMLSLKALSRWGQHHIAYEAVGRQLHAFEPHASLSMRRCAGLNLKSALSHTITANMASTQWRFMQEYAGLGGDAHHLKAELDAQRTWSLPQNMLLSVSMRSGATLPFGGATALFSDRYQLGGPTSVRSFKMNSLGPKDNADSLGGDLFYALGASLITPFPFKPIWPINCHLWINGGSLEQWQQDKGACQTLSSWLYRPSASAGLGLLYRHGPVRVEANFGMPLAAHELDGVRRGGPQLGIGISFL